MSNSKIHIPGRDINGKSTGKTMCGRNDNGKTGWSNGDSCQKCADKAFAIKMARMDAAVADAKKA
jgi:hypothetical protein